jgi:hypothetical protein
MKKLLIHQLAVSRALAKLTHAAEPSPPLPMPREMAGTSKTKRDASVQKLPKHWRRDPFPF